MDSCKENINTLYEQYKVGDMSWFQYLFTSCANILCLFGIIGNILCIVILSQEKQLSSIKNDKLNFRILKLQNSRECSMKNKVVEQISFITYQHIAVANISLLSIYYIFQLISFSEEIYFKKLTKYLIENELDQFPRWINEILYCCQDSIQCFILMLFLLTIFDQYSAVFAPRGRKLFSANTTYIKIYMLIVGGIIIICQSPNILIAVLEMKFFNAKLLSLKSLEEQHLTEIIFNVSEKIRNSEEKTNKEFFVETTENSTEECNLAIYNYEQWLFIILSFIYEICCNTIPFFLYVPCLTF